MRKKSFCLGLLLLLACLISGCAQKGEALYLLPDIEPADEVYVYTGRFDSLADREMLAGLQGAVARNTGRAAIYMALDENYALYLDYIKARYPDRTYYETTDLWSLFEIFAPAVTDRGYALYKSGDADMSRNNAVTVASAEGYVICDAAYTAKLERLGYTQKADGSAMTQRQCFETYRDRLDPGMLFHLHNGFDGTIDYCIANRNYMFAVEDKAYIGSPGLAFFEEVTDWADDNIPIFGTGGNVGEDAYTSMVSVAGGYNIPAEWAQNLSMLSGLKKDAAPKYRNETVAPKAGKHYMAFHLTDGDNAMIQMHRFPFDSKYYASPYRGQFPMTWGIAPTLADLCSPVLDLYYDNMTPNDCFVAGPSGIGYTHPSNYKDMEFLARATNGYMRRTGLRYVNLIDMLDPENVGYLDAFKKADAVKGGFIATGMYYAGGNHSVYWAGDKPFVTIADALWNESSVNQSVAHLSQTAAVKDHTSIEGYSIVSVHAWSADMTMLYNVLEKLPNDIELVTVDQLLDMVTKYVPHKNVTATL